MKFSELVSDSNLSVHRTKLHDSDYKFNTWSVYDPGWGKEWEVRVVRNTQQSSSKFLYIKTH